MTRKECLDRAAECVLKDRASQYGGVEDNFARIAGLWNAYLGPHAGIGIEAHDVAAMMALLKLARFRHNPYHEDSAVDCAGYAACMAECASGNPEGGFRIKSHVDEFFKAESGCFQNGNNQSEESAEIEPEYEPHERVQVQYVPGRWCGAEYICRASRWGHVVFVPGEKEEQTFRNEDVRRWPAEGKCFQNGNSSTKAEGCEALVFDEERMRTSMPGIVPED